LSGSRCDRCDDVVDENIGVDQEEFVYSGEIPGDDESECGDDDGAGVDPEHHLVWVHVLSSVGDIYFILPLGGEAIEADVEEHEDQPYDFRGGCFITVCLFEFLGKDGEYGDPNCDE